VTRDPRSWLSLASLDLPDRLLLTAVVLLPWAFGGIEIWAYRCAGLLIVVAATLRLGSSSDRGWHLAPVRWLLLPAVLMLGLVLLQLLPLPPMVLARASPTAHELYAAAFPDYAGEAPGDPIAGLEAQALAHVPEVEGIPLPRDQDESLSDSLGGRWQGWRPISLAPARTLERIFWYIPLLIAFLMFQAGSREGPRRRAFEAVLFLDFLALALFGLIFATIGNDKLYWIRSTIQDTHPFGPYVNPANFAAVMELALPWVGAAAVSAGLKRRSVLPFPILVATAVCCLLAGLLSGSRAAVALMTAALIALAWVLQNRARVRRALAAGLVGTVAVGALLVGLTGVGARVARFFEFGASGIADVERLSGWRAAGDMLKDFLLTGAGIGAFREVFPIYAPAGGDARMRHLHNDYLEVIVETGWPGALLLVWMIVAFAWLAVSNTKRSLTARGLLVGLACLFVHAAVDFNHQIPANALLFVAAAGIMVAREEAE
jgi:O-antigen ligase